MTKKPTPLAAAIQDAWPAQSWQGVPTIVAVSGGPDSVALLRILADTNLGEHERLIVAHFDHRQRGDESSEDARFVEKLGRSLGLPTKIGESQQTHANLSEEAAREQRYAFFRQVASQYAARYLVTGHTADDQAETVLFRILRGTGLSGLRGIPQFRPLTEMTTLVRPMLNVRRSEVVEYLEQIGQSFRTDSSNISRAFTRNRIRHDLLPMLTTEYHPNVIENLLRLAQSADDASSALDEIATELLDSFGQVVSPDTIKIDCRPLANVSRPIVRQMFVILWRRQNWPLSDMAFAKWNELATMCGSEEPNDPAVNQVVTFPGSIRAARAANGLTLTRDTTFLPRDC